MKGICFKEPLFHLTVQGVKKQTRRIIQVPKGAVGIQVQTRAIDGAFWGCYALNENEGTTNPKTEQEWVINPRYRVGETVYLKEPYYEWDDWDAEDGQLSYKFDNPEKIVPFWENKLFMPQSAARYFIKITGVRAERLQDISDEDCLKEGILVELNLGNSTEWFTYCNGTYSFDTPKEAYADLINEINGKRTWNSNPFVWVYDYDLTEEYEKLLK